MQERRGSASFTEFMLVEQGLRLIVTAAIIAVLFAVTRRAGAFFQARGDVAAPVEPVLGLPPSSPCSSVPPDGSSRSC